MSPTRSFLTCAALVGALVAPAISVAAAPKALSLMPWPAELKLSAGRVSLTERSTFAFQGHVDARLRNGLERAVRRLEARTGLEFKRDESGKLGLAASAAEAVLVIECGAASPETPVLGQSESYELLVADGRILLKAQQVVGALHGLETLLQLLSDDGSEWFIPEVAIQDQPRFPWRGLLIDVGRHWYPVEVIKRNLDGMAVVKLNVLHLHLTEDQGFRIESKRYPELARQGSDGNYLTQDQIREIIAYAADRGIRVMPEFDMPGHTTSWLASHPELGSGAEPQRYTFSHGFGIKDPTMDPTNESLYSLLDGFLAEMAALFPDDYLHIGGDEVSGEQWTNNPRLQQFIRERGLKDNHGLQAYFNLRLEKIVTKYGKHMIGWDNILHPDLPKNAVVHSWQGEKGLAEAAAAGHGVILSHGYYIDLCEPARQIYLVDPLPADADLTPVQRAKVLGGEAAMWGEQVSAETVDSRIWPRAAVVAERLWSSREVNDVADMYRRLDLVNRRVEEAGPRHESGRESILRRFAGDAVSAEELVLLRSFGDLLEPIKRLRRMNMKIGPGITQFTPYTTLYDYARPESNEARLFGEKVRNFARSEGEPRDRLAAELAGQLQAWQSLGEAVATLADKTNPRCRQLGPMARYFRDACGQALGALATRADPARADLRADLPKAEFPPGTVLLGVDNAVLPWVRLLHAALRAEAAQQRLTETEIAKFSAEYAHPLRW